MSKINPRSGRYPRFVILKPLYLEELNSPITEAETPDIELIGFSKTKELLPEESESVAFSIPRRHLTVFGKTGYVLARGKYDVYIGNSSENIQKISSFTVEKTEVIKSVTPKIGSDKIQTLSRTKNTHISGMNSGIALQNAEKPKLNVPFYSIKEHSDDIFRLVKTLTVKQLARLTVASSGGWGMENIGEAARLFTISELHLPKYIVADGNSGVNIKIKNIGMPSGVGICSSFNVKLAENLGRVIGEEAKENGIDMILAPAFNLHRHPLCGRHPEYFSEDPYLAGNMAGYYCRGLESAGIGGCYKHCVANNAETARYYNDSIMSERALRELYFRAFEYALEIHKPKSIMTSYNRLNGIPTAADAHLILGMFREENGFDGFVMTDWGSYDSVRIEDMVNAGNCWLTPGSNDDTFTSVIEAGVENGTILLERLQDNVYYLLKNTTGKEYSAYEK